MDFGDPTKLHYGKQVAAALAFIGLVNHDRVVLDTFSTIWFARVFPNIPPAANGLFGGWLLFCNVIALISAVTGGRTVRGETSSVRTPERRL